MVDRTFTVVYDGAVATHVIAAPHGNRAVRGNIFNITGTDGEGTIQIRNAQYLDNIPGTPTHRWIDISRVNPTMDILTMPNTIIIRNNRVVQLRDLQTGDQIRVLTHGLPDIVSGVEITGYIILVEG
jgi:hypothetical protein